MIIYRKKKILFTNNKIKSYFSTKEKKIWNKYIYNDFFFLIAKNKLALEIYNYYLINDIKYIKSIIKLYNEHLLMCNDKKERKLLNQTLKSLLKNESKYSFRNIYNSKERKNNFKKFFFGKSYINFQKKYVKTKFFFFTVFPCPVGYVLGTLISYKKFNVKKDNHYFEKWYKNYLNKNILYSLKQWIKLFEKKICKLNERDKQKAISIVIETTKYEINFFDFFVNLKTKEIN